MKKNEKQKQKTATDRKDRESHPSQPTSNGLVAESGPQNTEENKRKATKRYYILQDVRRGSSNRHSPTYERTQPSLRGGAQAVVSAKRPKIPPL